MAESDKKDCFVAAPIGEPTSRTRERSDLVLNYIIAPAVEPLGYKHIRADEMDRPGMITDQVIQQMLEAPLVIADLTDLNPNVFYELAIRHVTGKPLVQIMEEGQSVPFDVGPMRTIFVDHTHLGKASEAKEKIQAQIRSLESDPAGMETPITTSVDLQRLRHSEIPQERSLADILAFVQDIRRDLTFLEDHFSGYNEVQHRRWITDLDQRLSHHLEQFADEHIEHPRWVQTVSIGTIQQIAAGLPPHSSFLTMVGVFQSRAPWLHTLGIEVYRRLNSGDTSGSQALFREFRTAIRASQGILPPELRVAEDLFPRLFHDLLVDVEVDSLPL